ncbi:MAG: hypothetical protein AB1894_21975 [Chloroflexota bacterium]
MTTTTKPKNTRPGDKTAAYHGQMMLILARWILVLAGLVFILWSQSPIDELRVKLIVLLLLAAGNFYLCAQILQDKTASSLVVYLASLADLLVISVIILAEGGYHSPAYIFFFPAFLAISVAFTSFLTFTLVSGTLLLYAVIGVATLPLTTGDLQTLVTRLLMLAAVAVCGNLYWRLENSHRQSAVRLPAPVANLGEPDAVPQS